MVTITGKGDNPTEIFFFFGRQLKDNFQVFVFVMIPICWWKDIMCGLHSAALEGRGFLGSELWTKKAFDNANSFPLIFGGTAW